MEKTTGAGVGGGLEETLAGLRIRVPRPEDAGLEDCALSPGSIMEAFSRAASSFNNRTIIPSSYHDDADADADGCVRDPGPNDAADADALVGGIHQPVGRSCGGGAADDVVGAASDGGEVEGDDEKPILVR